jgi:arginyl-tRNA synthetase
MKTNAEIKAYIDTSLQKAVRTVFCNDAHASVDITAVFQKHTLDRPADVTKGEYASNIALVGSKLFHISAIESAIAIVGELVTYIDKAHASYDAELADVVSRIEVAGPGFINFYIHGHVFTEMIQSATLPESHFNTLTMNVGKRIAYEYTDPNPFKVFHIGHLMANTVGESLSRLGEYTGATIKRFCYQGDIGRHVALFVYGLRFMDRPFPTREEGEHMTLVDRMFYMGTSYAKGATYFKDHPEVEPEVQTINKKLYEKSDAEINEIYDLGLEWSLQYFETLYTLLGTTFDQYFFESACVAPARELINEGLAKHIFTESDGAIVFEGEKFQDESKGEKLHTRVFITKVGLPTYDAKELGFAKLKYDAFPYDQGIIVTAKEQDQYFKVNLKAQELMLPHIAEKNRHISHGMLILPTGKMSSRTGDVVSAEEMIESARAYALEVMKDRSMDEDQKLRIASQIAVAGIKYLILRQSSSKDVVFDVKKAMSFEGDSGPYLQYTAVRARSVLARAKTEGIDLVAIDMSHIEQVAREAGYLARKVCMFPEIIERAYQESSSHVLTTYVTELSAQFNAVYAQYKIIDTSTPEARTTSGMLLSLIQAVDVVLTKGVYILGFEIPEKM